MEIFLLGVVKVILVFRRLLRDEEIYDVFRMRRDRLYLVFRGFI